MGKLFCIMGKSCSGKDSIFKALKADQSIALLPVVTYTTRPRREGETDGSEYYFISEKTLENLRESGKVIELRRYDTVVGPWYYGTVDDGRIDLSKSNYIMIVTLEAFQSLRRFFGADAVVPIYIEVEDGLRLERALKRERRQQKPEYAEMCRRFLSDCRDFSDQQIQSSGITRFYENTDFAHCLTHIKADICSLIK